MENTGSKYIDYRFKILYAVGIIFIVAGHCGNGGISLAYDWFPPYAFHLGLFAFCSGYFYRDDNEKGCRKYIIKKIKRLIIPMYIWNLFYAVIVAFLSFKGFTIGGNISLSTLFLLPITSGHQFMYNLGGWFVVPLFMVEVFNVITRKMLSSVGIKGKGKEAVLFILGLCIGMGGVYLASIGLNTGWWLVLERMLYFIPFYFFGTFYNRILESHDTMRNTVYFAILFIIQLAIIVVFGRAPAYTPSWCNDFVDGCTLPFIVGFIGILFWLRIAKILEPVIGRSKSINLVADNTYSIMINQFAGFMLIKTIYAAINKFTNHFNDFNWQSYKEDIWYYYLPKGLDQTKIIYLVAGVVIPIIMQLALDKIKGKMETFIKRSRA